MSNRIYNLDVLNAMIRVLGGILVATQNIEAYNEIIRLLSGGE